MTVLDTPEAVGRYAQSQWDVSADVTAAGPLGKGEAWGAWDHAAAASLARRLPVALPLSLHCGGAAAMLMRRCLPGPAAVGGHDNMSELALGEETFSYSTAAGAIVDFSYKGEGAGRRLKKSPRFMP